MDSRPNQSTRYPHPPPAPGFLRSRRFLEVLATLAVLLFIGLALVMRGMQDAAVHDPELAAQLEADGALRQTAQLTTTVRSLKLVTVELNTVVTSRSTDENWRGDVDAVVNAPVKFSYGVDLSQLLDGHVSVSPVTGELVLRVPAPMRIATEVMGQREATEVNVGWGRLRSMAGEYHLGIARRDLYERAHAMALTPKDSRRVRDMSREQVARLASALIGGKRGVYVVFDDEPGWTIAGIRQLMGTPPPPPSAPAGDARAVAPTDGSKGGGR